MKNRPKRTKRNTSTSQFRYTQERNRATPLEECWSAALIIYLLFNKTNNQPVQSSQRERENYRDICIVSRCIFFWLDAVCNVAWVRAGQNRSIQRSIALADADAVIVLAILSMCNFCAGAGVGWHCTFFSVLFEESHTRTDTHKQAVSMQPNTMMFSPEDMFARFASSILSFNGRWFARAEAACLVPSLGLEQIVNVSLSLSQPKWLIYDISIKLLYCRLTLSLFETLLMLIDRFGVLRSNVPTKC